MSATKRALRGAMRANRWLALYAMVVNLYREGGIVALRQPVVDFSSSFLFV
jgi:hypothetical protein